MSQTLGEKLRQAREDRGISISEVAEQTRISPHYLECIENDDYGPLPGGIFNKGFVKSYAKFVGINEQEALSDYARLHSGVGADEPDLTYRPEVLTDDRASHSSVPTIIGAVVIVGLMSAGVLFLVDYLRKPAPETPARPASNVSSANTNTSPADQESVTSENTPEMGSVKIEFSAISDPVSLSVNLDGKQSSTIVEPDKPSFFEPKENIKLGYSRSLAANVRLSINGKEIALPSQPLQPKRNAIEFEINKENLARIWSSGVITTDVPAASPAVPEATGTPRSEAPSPTPANVAAVPSAPANASTPRPTPRPANAANREAARPTPRPTQDRPAATPAPTPAAPRNVAGDRPNR